MADRIALECAPHLRAGLDVHDPNWSRIAANYIPWNESSERGQPIVNENEFEIDPALRPYQRSIVALGLFHNILIGLPTGFGKTRIASAIIRNTIRWQPATCILFVAPTRPLCVQQAGALSHAAGLHPSKVSLLTGNTPQADRQRAWAQGSLLVATAETVLNDIKPGGAGYDHVGRVTLLVIDEAHKCTGNHAYAKLVRRFDACGLGYRICALTATPGESLESVRTLMRTLHINALDCRSIEDAELLPYAQDVYVDTVILQVHPYIGKFAAWLRNSLQSLCNKPVLSKLLGKPEKLTIAIAVLASENLENAVAAALPRGSERFNDARDKLRNSLGLIIELLDAVRGLETFGTACLHALLARVMVRAEAGDPARGRFCQSLEWVNHWGMLCNMAASNSHVGSPKLSYLVGSGKTRVDASSSGAASCRLADALSANPESRTLIFANSRNTVDTILTAIVANGGALFQSGIGAYSGFNTGPGAVAGSANPVPPHAGHCAGIVAAAFVGQARSSPAASASSSTGSRPAAAGRKPAPVDDSVEDECEGEDEQDDMQVAQVIDDLSGASGAATLSEMLAPYPAVAAYLPHKRCVSGLQGQSHAQQQAVVNAFQRGVLVKGCNVLVATCVAEEGLDLGCATAVVLYDAVQSSTRLIQRMGRVGRAAAGRATSLVTPDEARLLQGTIARYGELIRQVKAAAAAGSLPQYEFALRPYGSCVQQEAEEVVDFLCPRYNPSFNDTRVADRPAGAPALLPPLPFSDHEHLVQALLSGKRVRHPGGILLPRMQVVPVTTLGTRGPVPVGALVQPVAGASVSTGSSSWQSSRQVRTESTVGPPSSYVTVASRLSLPWQRAPSCASGSLSAPPIHRASAVLWRSTLSSSVPAHDSWHSQSTDSASTGGAGMQRPLVRQDENRSAASLPVAGKRKRHGHGLLPDSDTDESESGHVSKGGKGQPALVPAAGMLPQYHGMLTYGMAACMSTLERDEVL